MQIDKQTAARYMINCAIRNVFRGECPVSNHLIILSAKEILLDVAKSTNTVLRSDLTNSVKDEYKAPFRQLLKERYNFFKHADNDHDHEIDITNIQFSNELELILVTDNYKELFGSPTQHMQAFLLYCLVQHPKIYNMEDGKLAPDVKELFLNNAKELAKDGRRALCEFLDLHFSMDSDMKRERDESRKLSFREKEAVAEREGEFQGPFFKRKKQTN